MTIIDSVLARGLVSGTLDTRAVVIGTHVLDQTGPTFARLFPGARAVIIADGNTWGVAGEQVATSLAESGILTDEPIVYPATPTLFADNVLVDDLSARLGETDAVAVSIASGSLNDVTKLSSHRNNRPYLNVCTAASVDGYTSFGAAITTDGVKGTQECPAPRAIIVPLDIMAAAPTRLTATGYGDLIEKIPAGADWIVADELGREYIDDDVWGLVQGPLRDALADPVGLAHGDLASITKLAEGLIMSGLAMQVMGSSRPASGAGHYFSHQWEMEGLGRDWDPPLSHGFKVGLGTVAMCALYESLLKLDLTRYDIAARLKNWPTLEEDEARVRALQPNPIICAASVTNSAGKYVSLVSGVATSCLGGVRAGVEGKATGGGGLDARQLTTTQPSAQHGHQAASKLPHQTLNHAEAWLHHILDRWGAIQSRVASQVLPARVVEDMLRQVGAVHHPAQIGLSREDLRCTYYQAQTIRTRYTSLDTLQELGLLNDLVDSLFAPGGYWHNRPTPED